MTPIQCVICVKLKMVQSVTHFLVCYNNCFHFINSTLAAMFGVCDVCSVCCCVTINNALHVRMYIRMEVCVCVVGAWCVWCAQMCDEQDDEQTSSTHTIYPTIHPHQLPPPAAIYTREPFVAFQRTHSNVHVKGFVLSKKLGTIQRLAFFDMTCIVPAKNIPPRNVAVPRNAD